MPEGAETLSLSYLSFTWCVGKSSLCVLRESPLQPVAVDPRSPGKRGHVQRP